MNYPVWETELGHGMVMAVVAVLHTFISQFAIGAGLYLVVTEWWARRRGDAALLGHLHRHARFFVLTSLVFGAISGVGIWFTIGLVNPAGTSALIHAFVWGWAIEWVFFFVEIAAALVYLYGWDRFSPRRHLAVGWVYFAAAWLSLAVINGILSFMLTPGRWPETRSFWDGVLNPTYVPTLVLRTAICCTLAGGWALFTASREKDAALRTRVARIAGTWTLGGIVAAVPAALWSWSAAVSATAAESGPSEVERAIEGAIPAAAAALRLLPWIVGAAALVVAVFSFVVPRALRPVPALAGLALLLVALGAFEWVREGVRKPWLIRGYLYANGERAGASVEPLAGGLGTHAVWLRHREPSAAVLAEAGEDLFRVSCRNCHTVDGYLGIRSRVAGRSEAWLSESVGFTHRMRASMPAFRGSVEERRALGHWLASLTTVEEITYADADRLAAGGRVFARDCAPCHTEVSRVARAFRGLDPEDAGDWLDEIESSFEGRMPRFHGTQREKEALADVLSAAGRDTEGGR